MRASERKEISSGWNITKSVEFVDGMDQITNAGLVGGTLEQAKMEIANHARAPGATRPANGGIEGAKSIDTLVLGRVSKRPGKGHSTLGDAAKNNENAGEEQERQWSSEEEADTMEPATFLDINNSMSLVRNGTTTYCEENETE